MGWVESIDKDCLISFYPSLLLLTSLGSNPPPSCVPYVPDPENTNLLKTSLAIFRKFQQYPQALRVALMLNDMTLIQEIFNSCKDP